ncbi:MAG: 30S ribosomal protein S13 [Candidatus Cloacimonetes bacterium]|nr:30S ribosomal protein S13 [Candidatus Cloacimonadota bacterium]MBT4333944.1 30S ribosomal protein S13 [Candidatus Cloacimonadota bacterium]MBT5420604.1 30S ribosomal protein S13 [Candidatus Cloacimonadota bacterium]
MAHISGVELPREKRIVIGLTYIYGIGKSTAEQILAKVEIDENIKVKDLSIEQEKKLREIILDDYVVEGDLRTQKAMDIKRLMEINCYRGIRHKMNLPVRGQRTHTNARTRKGRKR